MLCWAGRVIKMGGVYIYVTFWLGNFLETDSLQG